MGNKFILQKPLTKADGDVQKGSIILNDDGEQFTVDEVTFVRLYEDGSVIIMCNVTSVK